MKYCINNCWNWGRISTRCWIHKSHPIPSYGVSFVDILEKIDRAITALHCQISYLFIQGSLRLETVFLNQFKVIVSENEYLPRHYILYYTVLQTVMFVFQVRQFLSYVHCNSPDIWNARITPRADSRFAPNQWETALHCNNASHWLGASLESDLTPVSLGQNGGDLTEDDVRRIFFTENI